METFSAADRLKARLLGGEANNSQPCLSCHRQSAPTTPEHAHVPTTQIHMYSQTASPSSQTLVSKRLSLKSQKPPSRQTHHPLISPFHHARLTPQTPRGNRQPTSPAPARPRPRPRPRDSGSSPPQTSQAPVRSPLLTYRLLISSCSVVLQTLRRPPKSRQCERACVRALWLQSRKEANRTIPGQ